MEVVVTIAPDGSAVIDVEGAVGKSCETVTEALARALGGGVTDVKHKDSYFVEEVADGVDIGR